MSEDKLDRVLAEMIELKTDMSYVKRHIASTAEQPIRVALLETKVTTLNAIAWKIGTVCGTALILAVLALII